MSEPMTQQRLAEIEARCEAATPGPWKPKRDFLSWDCNAAFIAHARQDIPALLAEVERLGADRDAWKRRAEAAEKDIEIILGTQKVCFACKNLEPCSNSTTGEYGCKPKWIGPRDERKEKKNER